MAMTFIKPTMTTIMEMELDAIRVPPVDLYNTRILLQIIRRQ